MECENIQQEKIKIQAFLRLELQKWRVKRKQQNDTHSAQKHRIFSLLNRFRSLHEEQNVLIQKEKVRLELLRQNLEDCSVKRIRNRLKYFILLNNEHEQLISKIREDAISCKWDKNILDVPKLRFVSEYRSSCSQMFLKACSVIKKRLQDSKFLRTPIFIEHLPWLLLTINEIFLLCKESRISFNIAKNRNKIHSVYY